MPYREPPPAGERKAITLRLVPALHDALRKWAADDLRSLGGQIEYVLHDAVVRAGRLKADD